MKRHMETCPHSFSILVAVRNNFLHALKLILLGSSLLVLTGCPFDKVENPPLSVPDYQLTQQESVINLPIRIPTKDIHKAIMQELTNPLAKGKSERISAKVLATESITERELIKELVSPAKPGYYVTKYKQVEKTFKESYKCLLKPWKWGKCWKDVVRIVSVPFQLWVEPVEAVYRYVSKDVTNLLDKVFKVGVWVSHQVDLQGMDVKFVGDSLHVDTDLKVNLMIDYEQASIPLGPTIKIKGLLNGNIEAKVKIHADITIKDNAELDISINENDTKIEITKLFLPSAVEGIEFATLIQPELYLVKNQLGKLVNKELKKQIEKQIDKNGDDLKFGRDIQELVKNNSKPFLLSEGTWLVPQPTKIAFSQISGQGEGIDNHLLINVGVFAKPNLVLSESAPDYNKPEELPIVTQALESKIYLYPKVQLEYAYTEAIVASELKTLVDREYSNVPYTTGAVTIYPSDDKLVVGVDLVKRNKGKKLATIYLWGVPSVDKVNMLVSITDLDFTLDSKNFLLETAEWLLHSKIKGEIQEAAKFSYKKDYEKIIQKVANFTSESEFAFLKGRVTTLKLEHIQTDKKSLVVYLKATGEALLEVSEREVELLTKESFGTIERSLESIVGMPQSIEQESSMGKVNALTSTMPLNRAAVNANVTIDANSPSPFINIGDTIYYEDSNGEILKRIAGPADVTVPGETVLVQGVGGNIYEVTNE